MSMAETLDAIRLAVCEGNQIHHTVINAAKIVGIQKDITLRTSINDADIINIDGQAVLWAARFLNKPVKEKVSGIDLMEQIIEMGCERILTSGQMPSVTDSVELVATLNRKAEERIIIMPGSGVRKENIKMLAEKTGCVEFHSSLRGKEKSKMEFIHPGFKNSEESYMNNAIDEAEVKALRKALE